MSDVRFGVGDLLGGQWPAEPVAQHRALVHRAAQELAYELRQGRRAVPQESGGNLRVEDPGRVAPTGPVQDLEVLPAGVGDGYRGPGEQRLEVSEVDRRCIDHGD